MKPIILKFPMEEKKVSPGQIAYVESNKHYLEFHVHGDVYRMRGSMKEIQDYFLAGHFGLINSSILVNLSMVDEWKGNEIKVEGQTFTISQKYKKEFFGQTDCSDGKINEGSRSVQNYSGTWLYFCRFYWQKYFV